MRLLQSAATLFLLSAYGFDPYSELPDPLTAQDLDKILERADKLLDEAKTCYEDARSKSSIAAFIDGGFKLEEARIKYQVLQEIGPSEMQKIAADRLRAVNQLTKLIHDGRVAISGTPGESASPRPPETPAAPAPPAEPSNPGPADVSKRVPVPDTTKQREAEKLIRDLFKEQYAKKTPADRSALAKLLLQQAAKSKDDPVGFWVFCREAQDLAAQSCDVKTALDAIDLAASLFDIDGLAVKHTTLMATAKVSKTPVEGAEIVDASMKLIEDLIAADQFDVADKIAASALLQAKRSADQELIARVTTRSKEVAEAKTLFQSMKGVMQTQAKSPDDPTANLEIGRFLCFVKGNWDLGLRFVVKGSDVKLKTLAQKELAFPLEPAERASLADGWWDLAEKEKSPLRKSQLLAHAKSIYESALPDAPALVRAKIEKRMEVLDGVSSSGAGVDLLALIEPNGDAVQGTWKLQRRTLQSPQDPFGRVQIRYSPPDEYDLRIVAVRRSGSADLYVGLPRGEGLMAIAFDADSGTHTYLGNTGLSATGRMFPDGKAVTVLIAVRKKDLTVSVEDKKIIAYQWTGGEQRQLFMEGWDIPNKKAMILGTHGSSFQVTKMYLTRISGAGRMLR